MPQASQQRFSTYPHGSRLRPPEPLKSEMDRGMKVQRSSDEGQTLDGGGFIRRFRTFGKIRAMQNLKDIPVKQTLPGFFGKMVHGDKGTLAIWDIKKGSILPGHQHPHEQITYLVEGELEMTIGGEKYLLTAGSVHVIPSNVPHSAHALTDCTVIDSFAPARDDYR